MSAPEPRPRRLARWTAIVVVGLVVLVVLFTIVFPWLERNLSNPTLDALGVDRDRVVATA